MSGFVRAGDVAVILDYAGRELMISKMVRYVPYGKHKHGCQLRYAVSFVGNPTTIDGAVNLWNRRAGDDE